MENKKLYSDSGFYEAKGNRESFLANLAINNYVATNTVELRNFRSSYGSTGVPLVVADMYNLEYGTFERTVSVLLDKFPKRINVKTFDVEKIVGTGKKKHVEIESVTKYLVTIVFKSPRIYNHSGVAPTDAQIFSDPSIGQFSRFLELAEVTETECLGTLTGNDDFSEEGFRIYNRKMNQMTIQSTSRGNLRENRIKMNTNNR